MPYTVSVGSATIPPARRTRLASRVAGAIVGDDGRLMPSRWPSRSRRPPMGCGEGARPRGARPPFVEPASASTSCSISWAAPSSASGGAT